MRVCETQCSCERELASFHLLTSSLHLRNLQVPSHTFHPLLVGCWFKLLTPTQQALGRTFSIDLRACLLAPSRSDIESE